MSETGVFYLVYYGFEKTVIESQVLVPLSKLKEDGLSPTIVFMEDVSSFFKSGRLRQIASLSSGFRIRILPRVPRNFLWLNSFLLFLVVLPSLLSKSVVVIHARGLQGAHVVLPMKEFFRKVRLICDVRGIEAAEYEYNVLRTKNRLPNFFERFWVRRLSSMARQSIIGSDAVFAVSKAMKSAFSSDVLRLEKKPWEYVPCAVDVNRFSAALKDRDAKRREMGIQDRVVVVYSGGLAAWQETASLARILSVMKRLEPRLFFLGLSPDAEGLKKVLTASHLSAEDFKVISLPFNQIQNALVCGDLGLLIRTPHALNRVACPTKFAEYLAAGLHVVTTPAIDDVVDLIKKNPIGTLLENIDNETVLASELNCSLTMAKDVTRRLAATTDVARRYFDWSHYLPVFKKWYD